MFERTVEVSAPPVSLKADITLPSHAEGLVLFAHGSGSSRMSPRNREVAAALNRRSIATLLLDLLTVKEEGDRANVFDIELLCRRLLAASRWASEQPETEELRLGYFGASTGAAAALCAAAALGDGIAAVVSRGGRPDLAGDCLERVFAPTLLIVGGADLGVVDLNKQAAARLRCPCEIQIVPGATHLFEEPGALERVAELAADWFAASLSQPHR